VQTSLKVWQQVDRSDKRCNASRVRWSFDVYAAVQSISLQLAGIKARNESREKYRSL